MDYSNIYKVKHYEANSKGQLTESYLLKYLSETAMNHTNYLQSKIEKLNEDNIGWMIYKYKGQVDRLPSIGEEFKIRTWSSRIYKFYANREFLVLDINENIIAKISTLWMYVDLDKRRPKRIPKDYIDIYGINDEFNFETFEELEEDIKVDYKSSYMVRRSDIDSNNHVNNSIYFEWMMECIPYEIYNNYNLHEFNITFKKETMYNDIITSELEYKDEDNYKICNHKILDSETKEIKTLGKTIWKKR